MIAAGIDPTWKINHLYSAELFPTSVRSMARGVCNAGGRLGSVMAPMVGGLVKMDFKALRWNIVKKQILRNSNSAISNQNCSFGYGVIQTMF